jgi:hypothetical protein
VIYYFSRICVIFIYTSGYLFMSSTSLCNNVVP